MNDQSFINKIISDLVNQALIRRGQAQLPLPDDQKEAEKKILDAIHDLFEAKKSVKEDYRNQIIDAMIIKIAIELGWINEQTGGMR